MTIASLRTRLTLWHTGVLAVLIVSFAIGAYAFLERGTWSRTDAALLDAATDLRTELLAERGDHSTTRRAAAEVLPEVRFTKIAFVVYDSAGGIVAASIPPSLRASRTAKSDGEMGPPFDPGQLAPLVRSGRSHQSARTVALPDAEGGYRAALEPLSMPDGQFTAVAARSVHDEAEMLSNARLAIAIAVPLALLLSALGGWLLARKSLAPMVIMREQASRIGATNLGQRLPVTTPGDEVGQLSVVINELLERVDRAFVQQRQFMADASHELRTPLAVVQNESSVALGRVDRSASEYQDALQVIRSAGRRMARIVDDLFLLARADTGDLPLRSEPLYLNDLVNECAREARTLAAGRDLRLDVDAATNAPFEGDEMLLRRLVLNLIENAIKYTPSGGRVDARLSVSHAAYRLEVEDTGAGVPAEVRSRIFDRFVRGDGARSHADDFSSGAGLGLPIAKWIAQAHGGRIELERTSAAGSLFVLTLPQSANKRG
jgi:two-component system, OmpR family, sensor kinase